MQQLQDGDIQENNNERRNICNLNRWRIISIIFVIVAIFMYQYSPPSETFVFSFEEFINYYKNFGLDDIFKLPSNEVINQNIVNCTSLALRIEQSVAFNNTGPQLVVDLNEFSSKLDITKSSYTKMYNDGAWFIWSFEQFINDTLNHRNNLKSSLKESIEALNNFYSSVEEAHKATLTAESFRSGTHKQVIKARNEVKRFIKDKDNPSLIERLLGFIGSITDTKEINGLKVEYNIATEIESYLTYLDNDLNGIKMILLRFKDGLKKHSHYLLKLQAGIEQLKLNENEVEKARELLNMIKENHKNFKSRANQ